MITNILLLYTKVIKHGPIVAHTNLCSNCPHKSGFSEFICFSAKSPMNNYR